MLEWQQRIDEKGTRQSAISVSQMLLLKIKDIKSIWEYKTQGVVYMDDGDGVQ
jgi:hypothetical protein